MKAGCGVGCQPAVSLDEAGWQPTLQQPQSVSAPRLRADLEFPSHYLELSVHFFPQNYSSREEESVAKSKDQKKKDREKRVAKQKLVDAARRREVAKTSEDSTTNTARGRKVITAGVKQHAQVQTSKPSFAHRRTGG